MAFFTNTVIGVGALVVLIQTVWSTVGPELPPITIHSITYSDGMIVADRTVSASGPFRAVREVRIIDARTGVLVPGCEGATVWDYAPGRLAPEFTVRQWVGNDDCHLGPGTYTPYVTYSAGEFMIEVKGDPFKITPEIGK